MSGRFIVLEGGDGAGKTTQARLLAERLRARGVDVVLTQEPAGTALGQEIKGIFQRLHAHAGGATLSARAELLLFEAARAEHVETVIRPALEAGKTVVCDRFTDSSLAYQGYGRGLPLDEVRRLSEIATGGLEPDLVIVLDVAPELGVGRADSDGGRRDSIGQETLEFHRRVRQGFLEIAKEGGSRYVVVDATRGREEVAEEMAAAVMRVLNRA